MDIWFASTIWLPQTNIIFITVTLDRDPPFTGRNTEAEIDKLMEMTDPDLVYLLYDTGHLSFSGEDAIGVLKKYVNRVKHVHLKSIRQDVINEGKEKGWSFLDCVRAGSFTVPGDGDFDFTPVFS